jgi:hypothetical protein
MLWIRKFIPVPPAVQPRKAVGDRVHRAQEVALEGEAGEVVGDGLAAQVHEHGAQLGPDVALGGLLDSQGLGQPGRADVLAQLAELGLHLLVRLPVGLREERDELAPHLRLVGAEEQVAAIGGGQEVVRVAAQERQLDAELREQLGRHQAQQVGSGGGGKVRCLLERTLGATGAADDRLLLEDSHAQARTRKKRRSDQAVVARAYQ